MLKKLNLTQVTRGLMDNEEKEIIHAVIGISKSLMWLSGVVVIAITLIISNSFYSRRDTSIKSGPFIKPDDVMTNIPATMAANSDTSTGLLTKLPVSDSAMINYGRELIANTARYLGPNGTVAHLTNGMNCQNCHLSAGTRLFSNNFSGFVASYPKFSNRSGRVEPASTRIAECFERSLNGKVPDINSKELQAILAYMKWIGQPVKSGSKIYGGGTEKITYLNKPANPESGKAVYILKCQRCHGNTGEGILASDKRSYIYPPLWGAHSYNDGAGMYRLGNFAGFVKNNMPYGVTYKSPQLTVEEAWNVAAFVNSQPRPHRDQRSDYPDPLKKPVDLPVAPFADHFSIRAHKYGPFAPIDQQHQKTLNQKVL